MKKKVLFSILLAMVMILAACGAEEVSEDIVSDDDSMMSEEKDTSSEDTMMADEEKSEDDPATSGMVDEETPADGDDKTEEVAPEDEMSMTLTELADYNGQNGMPAYVAVDGIIYDVSDVPQWFNGKHNGVEAGNDVTAQITGMSPHGVKVLEKLPVVGSIVDE